MHEDILTLSTLGEEALFEILSFLTATDLCKSLSLVSKAFNECSGTGYLWKKLCEQDFKLVTRGKTDMRQILYISRRSTIVTLEFGAHKILRED